MLIKKLGRRRVRPEAAHRPERSIDQRGVKWRGLVRCGVAARSFEEKGQR
jgi:hypothetical protein